MRACCRTFGAPATDYVELVAGATLVEAVAASLTETLAPDLMRRRIAAWQKHYPWLGADSSPTSKARVSNAERDGREALEFVLSNAQTHEEQAACVRALVEKTEILWRLLDAMRSALASGRGSAGERACVAIKRAESCSALSRKWACAQRHGGRDRRALHRRARRRRDRRAAELAARRRRRGSGARRRAPARGVAIASIARTAEVGER